MTHRLFPSLGACAAAIVLVALPATPVVAQAPDAGTWTLPRTPDGHPDLQGVWSNLTSTPLERRTATSMPSWMLVGLAPGMRQMPVLRPTWATSPALPAFATSAALPAFGADLTVRPTSRLIRQSTTPVVVVTEHGLVRGVLGELAGGIHLHHADPGFWHVQRALASAHPLRPAPGRPAGVDIWHGITA